MPNARDKAGDASCRGFGRRLIGDGGMGSVFEAKHELLVTTVALKFLHAALSRRKGLVERIWQPGAVRDMLARAGAG